MSRSTPVPRNATELVELVENQLGWDPWEQTKGGTVPLWKVKAIEAGKINAAIKRSKSGQVTLENLAVALDFCRRHKKEVLTPSGLTYFLKDALTEQRQPEVVSDLESDIAAAVAEEQALGDEHSAMWLGRFVRAVGPFRQVAYDEWKAARHG